mmetsp:Transcript_2523/g.5329  ORF Transcript_2523/g.5329 Transcript_2523/m.5329 type:complete len:328 (+) Transcript_2523:49-1032(+)
MSSSASSSREPRRIQVSVRAKDLKNAASRFKKSDPYAVLTITGGPYDGRRLGRTETIRNNLSPDWCKIFIVDFWAPGTYCPITIGIFDDNGDKNTDPMQARSDRPGEADVGMGEATCDLHEMIDSPGNERSVDLPHEGRIFMHAVDSVGHSGGGSSSTHVGSTSFHGASSSASAPPALPLQPLGSRFKLHIRGLDLDNVESGILGLNRTDPYFEISKKLIDHSSGITRWKPVYRSAHVKNILNPFWDEFYIDLEILCNCDLDWPLKLTVLDHDKKTRHKIVGSVEVTASAMMRHRSVNGNNADRENAFQLQNGAGRICILAADVILP